MSKEQDLLEQIEQNLKELKALETTTEGERYALLMLEFRALAERAGHQFRSTTVASAGAMLGREWKDRVEG